MWKRQEINQELWKSPIHPLVKPWWEWRCIYNQSLKKNAFNYYLDFFINQRNTSIDMKRLLQSGKATGNLYQNTNRGVILNMVLVESIGNISKEPTCLEASIDIYTIWTIQGGIFIMIWFVKKFEAYKANSLNALWAT